MLHHKDTTLIDSDIERYIEWRIEDLQPMSKSEHMKYHQTGKRNNFYGKHHSEEQKEKWRQTRKGHPGTYFDGRIATPVRCIETGVVYESAQIATEACGHKASSHIRAVCRGANAKAFGYT